MYKINFMLEITIYLNIEQFKIFQNLLINVNLNFRRNLSLAYIFDYACKIQSTMIIFVFWVTNSLKMGVATTRAPIAWPGPWVSTPNQIFCPLAGLFGSTEISKSSY